MLFRSPTQGQAQLAGNLGEGCPGQIAMELLHLMEHLDQGTLPAPLAAHDLLDGLAIRAFRSHANPAASPVLATAGGRGT